MSLKVVIVDDHDIVRDGIQSFLKLDPQIEVVGAAVNGVEAVQKTRELKPDVVLMDITMPVMDGFEATTIIKRELPGVRVLMLSFGQDEFTVQKAHKVGADGYVLKGSDLDTLIQAIKAPS